MIGGYQFSPWFPFSEQKRYSIDKHNIIGDSSVVEEIKKEYIKYALTKRTPVTPESTESLIARISNQIADRFELEDIDDEYNDTLPDSKETVH